MTVCSLHGDSSDHDDHHEKMRDEITMIDGWMGVIICNLNYICYAHHGYHHHHPIMMNYG